MGATALDAKNNDGLLRALRRQPVERTPIWLMRQAGRYLPEYRATRGRAGDFMALCQNPQLALEVTLQPLARFDLDAAILFSDILTVPDAMGLGLYFETGEGPKFRKPVRSRAAIDALPIPDPEADLGYVLDAVRVIRQELDGRVPLIGFSGSPWTLATYMVEGGSSRDFRQIKTLLYNDPEALDALLEKLSEAVVGYLNGQIAAGAQVVQIFDTWGGVLTTDAYRRFSLRHMERIVAGLHPGSDGGQVPVILFTKQGGHWLELIAKSGCQAVGLDWTFDIGRARQLVGDQVALQGNLDPAVLFASTAAVRAEATRVLDGFGPGPGHVFNLGHGIQPGVNPDRVKDLVDAVHNHPRG